MSYCYLSSTTVEVDPAALQAQATEFLQSVATVGLAGDVLEDLCAAAAAVLHIGNLEFVETPKGGGLRLDSDLPLVHACRLLRVPQSELMRLLTTSTQATAEDVVTRARSKADAEWLRDALAEQLYRGAFQFLVRRWVVKAPRGSA